jgi:hypothetical protein
VTIGFKVDANVQSLRGRVQVLDAR